MIECSVFASVDLCPESAVVLLPFKQDKDSPIALFQEPSLLASCNVLVRSQDFVGKLGDTILLYPEQGPRLLVVGLGEEIAADVIRDGYARAVALLVKRDISSIAFFPPKADEERVRWALEGIYLGAYQFTQYKTESVKKGIERIFCLTEDSALFSRVEQKVSSVMNAVYLARDLVNRNADEVSAQGFSEIAASLDNGALRVQVHGKDWIEQERMHLLLAVGKGAVNEPRFIIAEWKGAPKDEDLTVLIGKGVTFDSGGLNLKSSSNMEGQKGDMAGAAAVLAVMQAIRDLQLPINVTAAIPLCENSIDAKSYKPGDVYISRSGRTVEILSTDAEGRLILADAIDYVRERLNPSRIIDVATLTGSAEVALGKDISALFSNDDLLSNHLQEAGIRAGELMWPMPLYYPYAQLLDSEIADCKNVATSVGGAINAALYLHKYVGDISWAHLDIAGPADMQKPFRYYGIGATGVPVRTLVEYLAR